LLQQNRHIFLDLIQPALWIRICIDFGLLKPGPEPGEQNLPKKSKEVTKFYVLKRWVCFLGLKASPVTWTSFVEA
jgi:hypothetical protein